MTLLCCRPYIDYDDIGEVEDTYDPNVIIKVCQRNPAVARQDCINEGPWGERGHLAIYSLMELEGVTVDHVREMHRLMKRRLPKELLSNACYRGCEPNIILYLVEQNPRTVLMKHWKQLPIYYLLGSCGPQHMPALKALLKVSYSRVKKNPAKYHREVLTNPNCPSEILDWLESLLQGRDAYEDLLAL